MSAIVDITQSLVQFNSRWILQLINGISKDFQSLLKCFSLTAIFAFSNTPFSAASVELAVETFLGFPEAVTGVWSLINCHNLSEVSE